MDTKQLIEQLKSERDRIDEVINLLSGIGTLSTSTKASNGTRTHKRRRLSAEARARIAAAQRKRWAKQKKVKA